MRLFHTVAALMVAIPGVVPAMAQSQVKLTVDATMDLYRAGGYNDGSDGIAPAVFSFTAGAGQTITFPNVSPHISQTERTELKTSTRISFPQPVVGRRS
jgi:hypothetical protein